MNFNGFEEFNPNNNSEFDASLDVFKNFSIMPKFKITMKIGPLVFKDVSGDCPNFFKVTDKKELLDGIYKHP